MSVRVGDGYRNTRNGALGYIYEDIRALLNVLDPAKWSSCASTAQ